MEIKKISPKRIGEILIEEGTLDSTHLERALELQKKEGGLIGVILVRQGWVSEENLVIALSKQLGIPFLRLSHYNVSRAAQRLIPKEVAERFLFFPFDGDKETISFAMSDPLNTEALEAIEKRVPQRVHIFLATVTEIKEAISLYYGEDVTASKGMKSR